MKSKDLNVQKYFLKKKIKQTNRFCVEIKKFVLLNKISLSLEIVIWGKKQDILGKGVNQKR